MNMNEKFNTRSSITPANGQLKIIYWALMIGRLLQVGLLFTVFQPTEKMTEDELVIYLVILIASLEGVISYFAYKKIHGPGFESSKLYLFFNKNFKRTIVVEHSTGKGLKKNNVETVISELSIMCWAVSFSVGVFGMLIPFLGGSNTEGLVLIFASLILGMNQKPK
tara:strand:+ start:2014 stop:2511 length:498 start_codon:yes stop_codon:yes gene_type:complete